MSFSTFAFRLLTEYPQSRFHMRQTAVDRDAAVGVITGLNENLQVGIQASKGEYERCMEVEIKDVISPFSQAKEINMNTWVRVW